MKTLMMILLIACIVPPLSGCRKKSVPPAPTTDPMQYTTAEAMELTGAENLYKMSDDLYRGEQPTTEGFKGLKAMGIKTVVNLRKHHSDTDELEGIDMNYVSIPMNTWDPEMEHVHAFLKVVTDESQLPIFVHCMHGSDRTGTMCAVYRMVVQGWDRDKAIDEMTKGPFGYHKIWKGLPEFLRELDIEALQAQYVQPQ
ncbi:MAG: fused DSP-PTPase phosphatase/NAD kinase-like protein [Planctomycetota bacterium]|jgi:protein tyrosine phosphatase (PTP) superfamily phosphohydrolase (DUF442 family)